jgi:hypothetical protein
VTTSNRELLLCANSAEEMNIWYDAIQQAINLRKDAKGFGISLKHIDQLLLFYPFLASFIPPSYSQLPS